MSDKAAGVLTGMLREAHAVLYFERGFVWCIIPLLT
jgi:hypothetical protein